MKTQPISAKNNLEPKTSKRELLLKTLLKLKLYFADIYVEFEGGTGSSFEFDVKPKDFLRFAKKDFKDIDIRGRINAITNAKRAIDCQTDTILSILKIRIDQNLPIAAADFIKLINLKENIGEKHSFKLIEALGIAPIGVITKIRKLRHDLEHFYKSPTNEQTSEAIELAELYINATDHKIRMTSDILIYQTSEGDSLTNNNQFSVRYEESNGAIGIFFNTISKPIKFYNTDLEFYYFLKATYFYDDEDELADCLTGLLNYIKHPQSKIKVKVNV